MKHVRKNTRENVSRGNSKQLASPLALYFNWFELIGTQNRSCACVTFRFVSFRFIEQSIPVLLREYVQASSTESNRNDV